MRTSSEPTSVMEFGLYHAATMRQGREEGANILRFTGGDVVTCPVSGRPSCRVLCSMSYRDAVVERCDALDHIADEASTGSYHRVTTPCNCTRTETNNTSPTPEHKPLPIEPRRDAPIV